jgi:hypothetical protein
MPRKSKFRPEITRVKLNPEQAVLACDCYDVGVYCEKPDVRVPFGTGNDYCIRNDPKKYAVDARCSASYGFSAYSADRPPRGAVSS